MRRAHKFLTDERKVKGERFFCFFVFNLPQYLRIPEGWVSPLLLGYFVSISEHPGTRPQCLLSRRVCSALSVRLSSIHTFQSPGSEFIPGHWSSHEKSPPTPSLPLCQVWYSLCLGPTVFTHHTLSPLDQKSIPQFHLSGEGLLFFFLTKICTFPSWIAQTLGTLRLQWLISETKLSSQELFPNKSTRGVGVGRVEPGR